MTPQIKQRIDQLRRGEVPEGYTKTKEGIIPSDWTIKKMKQWISLEERPVTLQDDEDYELVTVRRAYGGVDSRGIYKGKDVLVKTYFSVEKDDFIISKRQIAHGACGLVPEKLHGAVVSNEYNVFKANEGTNIHFFNLMMQLPHYKRLFYLMSDGVHIEKLLFKTGDWMKRSLAMPPLAEQKKIAEILSAQDKLIALKEKLIEEKKLQKKYLMQQLLTGKKRLPGFSGEWERVKLADIAGYITERKVMPQNVYLSTENIKSDYMGVEFSTEQDNIEGIHYIEDDILISNIRPYLKKVWFSNCEGVCSSDILVLRAQNSLPKYLYYIIARDAFVEYVMNGVKGTKMPRGDKKHIMQIDVYSPSLSEQDAIVSFLSNIDHELALLNRNLDQEKQKKKALMQLLLSGVVRVNV